MARRPARFSRPTQKIEEGGPSAGREGLGESKRGCRQRAGLVRVGSARTRPARALCVWAVHGSVGAEDVRLTRF
jgi:hypothetical protein